MQRSAFERYLQEPTSVTDAWNWEFGVCEMWWDHEDVTELVILTRRMKMSSSGPFSVLLPTPFVSWHSCVDRVCNLFRSIRTSSPTASCADGVHWGTQLDSDTPTLRKQSSLVGFVFPFTKIGVKEGRATMSSLVKQHVPPCPRHLILLDNFAVCCTFTEDRSHDYCILVAVNSIAYEMACCVRWMPGKRNPAAPLSKTRSSWLCEVSDPWTQPEVSCCMDCLLADDEQQVYRTTCRCARLLRWERIPVNTKRLRRLIRLLLSLTITQSLVATIDWGAHVTPIYCWFLIFQIVTELIKKLSGHFAVDFDNFLFVSMSR